MTLDKTLRRAAIAGAILAAIQLTPMVHAITPSYLRPVERAEGHNWYANYAHTAYGRPVALVVPPTAQLQTNWSWGAASSSISRMDHQFTRNFQGSGSARALLTTPHWPRCTRQTGVYYIRGPWHPTQP